MRDFILLSNLILFLLTWISIYIGLPWFKKTFPDKPNQRSSHSESKVEQTPKKRQKSASLSRRVSKGASGAPPPPKYLHFSRSPDRRYPLGGTFEPSPPTLSYTPLTSSFANVKHPSSAAVWAYAHLDKELLLRGPG